MWTVHENYLKAELIFRNFSQAFAFMTEVAMLAERHHHHPNWSNVWNRVEIQLNTHDAGDVITEKDRKLAAAIEEVYARYNT
jgi:4a-hydroxytetrahydrobiopterin dehydratase